MIDSTVHTYRGTKIVHKLITVYSVYMYLYNIQYEERGNILSVYTVLYLLYSMYTVVEIHYSVGQPDSGMWRKLLFRPGREGFPGNIFWLFNII